MTINGTSNTHEGATESIPQAETPGVEQQPVAPTVEEILIGAIKASQDFAEKMRRHPGLGRRPARSSYDR